MDRWASLVKAEGTWFSGMLVNTCSWTFVNVLGAREGFGEEVKVEGALKEGKQGVC